MNPPKRKRRWLRVLIAVLVLGALLVLGVPLAVGAFGPGWLTQRLERDLAVRASLAGLSVGPTGSVTARGLALDDLAGRPLVRLDALDARVRPLAALGGRYDVDLELSGLELHLRREGDGRWNVQDLPRDSGDPPESGDTDEEDERESRDSLPEVAALVRLADVRIFVHEGDATAVLTLADFDLALDDLERPASFAASGSLCGEGAGGGALTVSGNVALAERGRIAPRGSLELALEEVLLDGLRPIVAGFVPLAELSGRLSADAQVRLDSQTGPSGTLDVTALDLLIRGESGEPVRLERLVLHGEAAPAEAGPGAQRVTLAADELFELTWDGTTTPGADGAVVEGRLALEAELERLATFATAWTSELVERRVSGALEVDADLRADLASGVSTVDARLGLARLGALGADGAPLALADGLEELRASVSAELGPDALEVTAFSIDGPLHAAGSLAPTSFDFDDLRAKVELDVDLGRLAPVAAAYTGEAYDFAGRLALEADVQRASSGALAVEAQGVPSGLRFDGNGVDAERFEVRLTTTLGAAELPFELDALFHELVVELAAEPETEPPPPLAFATLGLEGRGTLRDSALELESLAIESDVVRGTLSGRIAKTTAPGGNGAGSGYAFDGLTGDLVYVPERAGALLAHWIPGTLTGLEERSITFRFDGEPMALDAVALLRALEGESTLGIGRYEVSGFALDGDVTLAVHGGVLDVESVLGANGGKIELTGRLAPSAESAPETGAGAAATLSLRASGVRANRELALLFAFVHPAFAQVRELENAELDGVVEAELELAYDAPLSFDALARALAGEGPVPLEPIAGKGRLEVREIEIEGSPLLDALEGRLADGSESLRVRPMAFDVKGGRVYYANPWTWTFSDAETTFTGSVGLDETLDLVWNVPVTEALVERYEFLKYAAGETLAVPLRGTAKRPELEWTGVLDDLAKSALKRGLGEKLGIGGAEDPAELLKTADDLWSKGSRAEAAVLYAKLREDYKLSIVYALNRDRIKERSKFSE